LLKTKIRERKKLFTSVVDSDFIESRSGISIESGSWVLMTKLKKKKIWRVKIAIKKSLGLFKGSARYRRSLQPSKENIQRFKK